MDRLPQDSLRAEKLSVVVERLMQTACDREMTVEKFLHELNLGGHMFVCLVFSTPFLIPMPLPGVSTPLGLAIAIAALQIILGLEPWVPKSWRHKPLSKDLALKILGIVLKLLKITERCVAPRLKFFAKNPAIVRFNGLLLFVLAVMLALPMPPGFNAPPALAIILLSLGSLENDGIAIIAGYILTVLNVALFAAVFILGFSGLKSLLGLA
jgi:hypothetical protein